MTYSAGELSTASSDISFQSEKNVTSHKRSSSDYAVSVPETTDNHRMHSASAGDLSSSSISATLKLEKVINILLVVCPSEAFRAYCKEYGFLTS